MTEGQNQTIKLRDEYFQGLNLLDIKKIGKNLPFQPKLQEDDNISSPLSYNVGEHLGTKKEMHYDDNHFDIGCCYSIFQNKKLRLFLKCSFFI